MTRTFAETKELLSTLHGNLIVMTRDVEDMQETLASMSPVIADGALGWIEANTN